MGGDLVRITTSGMRIVNIPMDGNCFFSCFAQHRYKSADHLSIRTGLVDFVLENWNKKISLKIMKTYRKYFLKYQGITTKQDFKNSYTKTKSTSGKNEHWGGSYFYQAACELYRINLIVITETESNNLREREVIGDRYTPLQSKASDTCYILFRNNNHYDLIELSQ
jgi:hypothetical protein